MKFIFTLALSAFVALAHADLADLEGRTTRPNMPEVLRQLNAIERGIRGPMLKTDLPGAVDYRLDILKWLDQLLQAGPRMIAHFERTYPGATWVFLGRDGLPWADLFEAYYINLGQSGRVIRLGVSKPTMKDVNDAELVSAMRGEGIQVDRLDQGHPYVFVDSVSKGFGQQGRRLIASLYRHWVGLGRDPLLLVNKVDMIGLIVSTFKGVPNDIVLRPLHQYLQALYLLQLEADDRGLPAQDFEQGLRILTYGEQPNQANEAGYTHFIGAWHESFGPLRIDETSGRWRAQPGAVAPVQMRRSILWLQKEIWRFVLGGECQRLVERHAQMDGYPALETRPAPATLDPVELRRFRARATSRRLGRSFAQKILPKLLLEDSLGPADRDVVAPLTRDAELAMKTFDWNQRARPETALADVQLLQRALDFDCARHLEVEP